MKIEKKDGFSYRLNYHRFGNGEKYLLAIHGFADSGELFFKIQEAFIPNFTVIAIDLPFHGHTYWPDKEFYPEQLFKSVSEIFDKEGVTGNFSVIGHSMGGRIILALSEYFMERIDLFIFLAPAGFQGTLSDSRVLFPKFYRKHLKTIAQIPFLVKFIIWSGKKLGIINKGTYRFLEQQMLIPERKKRLFDCWISLFNFPIQLKKFKADLILHKKKIVFFYGDRDFITPAKYGCKFIENIPGASVHLVEDGHYFLREPLKKALERYFLINIE